MADMEEKKEKTGLIELESLKDLVHLIVNTPLQIMNYTELLGKHYYFMIISGMPGFSRLIYYITQDTPIQENFIIYDNLNDQLSYGEKKETRGGLSYIPIIHIKKQNLLTIEDFTMNS
ncbi:MAG: hypothetical protein ACTSQI_03850 [Candidatus Helarchaeota archaeon]